MSPFPPSPLPPLCMPSPLYPPTDCLCVPALRAARCCCSENGITNGIEILNTLPHGTCIMTSNNDSIVRVYSAETFQHVVRIAFPWAVNYATLQPEGRLVAVVGDDPTTQLADIHNGITVARLMAHKDYSFAAAWHPDGHLLATGNQDTTAVVWDIRHTAAPVTILPGRMGAIRSLRFTSDGRFLAMAEPADFIHIYDVHAGFEQSQEIDLFGEVSGISFSPNADALFIGIAETTYSSLLQFERQHHDVEGGLAAGKLWGVDRS